METRVAEQGSAEWLKDRWGKITSTVSSALEGVNPWKKPEGVVRDHVRGMSGAESEFKGNPATEHGIKTEPIARAFFEKTYGMIVDETGSVVHPDYSFLQGSPDGLVGLDAIIEIKCPYNTTETYSIFDPKKKAYLWQVRHMMEVCNVSKCYFLCYISPDNFLKEEVERIPGWLDETLSGQLMPVPQTEQVTRVELYKAWHNQIHIEYQDPELRQKHLDPLVTYKEVRDCAGLNELGELAQRAQRLKERIEKDVGVQQEELARVMAKIKTKRKGVAEQHRENVTNGVVKLQYTKKKSPRDWEKAFDFLGGEEAVKDAGGDMESFRKTTAQFQTKITLNTGEVI